MRYTAVQEQYRRRMFELITAEQIEMMARCKQYTDLLAHIDREARGIVGEAVEAGSLHDRYSIDRAREIEGGASAA
jgi:hypothetical protein